MLDSMKILVVGDGHSAIHEVAVVEAFKQLGHQVESFYWQAYFSAANVLFLQWRLTQHKFLIGPTIKKLNKDLIKKAVQFSPDLIFIYRGTHITSNTIIEIRRNLPNSLVYGYNNDDPFSKEHPPWLWRNFLESVPVYDIVFAYRHHNLDDFTKMGAKRVELLRSWFIPRINRPVRLSWRDSNAYESDVVFIGHYEDDGRMECLEEIVKAGIKLRLFGPPYEWDHRLAKSTVLKNFAPVRLIWNEEYNKVICGSKIALCFFSKLNRDTYTRRCFEIPAAGTLLLSEYSEDLSSIYRAGKEADFFRDKDELMKKVKLYLNDRKLRDHVASNGFHRVKEDGHDVVSRMESVLEFVGSDFR